jgi:hypothetical protein
MTRNCMTNFDKIMGVKSNAELIQITTELKDDYQKEAVDSAVNELQKRNLTKEEIASATTDLKEAIKDKSDFANIPLPLIWKILTFVKPGVIQFFIATRMRGEGKYRKADELSKFTKYGFIFYGVVFLITFLFLT